MKLFKTIPLAAMVGLVASASAQYDFIVLQSDAQAWGAGPGQQVGLDMANQQAMLWNGGASAIPLHPSIYDTSIAVATDGTHQVGTVTDGGGSYAYQWASSSAGTNLHIPLVGTYDDSQAFGVSGNYVVGQGVIGFSQRAILWTSPVTYEDLTPLTFDSGAAYGVAGGTQVGFVTGSLLFPGEVHAAMWAGLALTFVDLHPAGAVFSFAYGTDGTQTVGEATFSDSIQRAALWNGVVYVPLHPVGFDNSKANAVAGGKQVGVGTETASGNQHALLWNGTSVATDLHAFATGYVSSEATGIDPAGNITGYAFDGLVTRAVYWKLQLPYFGPFDNPINDPPTPESVFKRNKSIRLQLRLFAGDGSNFPDQIVRLEVEALGTSEGEVNEEALAQGQSVGNLFTYDASSQSYIYHMSTKTLQAGVRYQIRAILENPLYPGTVRTVTIGLR